MNEPRSLRDLIEYPKRWKITIPYADGEILEEEFDMDLELYYEWAICVGERLQELLELKVCESICIQVDRDDELKPKGIVMRIK